MKRRAFILNQLEFPKSMPLLVTCFWLLATLKPVTDNQQPEAENLENLSWFGINWMTDKFYKLSPKLYNKMVVVYGNLCGIKK